LPKIYIDIIDSGYNLVYVSPGFKNKRGDYAGRKCYEYFFNRRGACPGCKIPEALETKRPASAVRTFPSGRGRTVQITSVPFRNEEGKWLVANVNTDITAIRDSASALDYFSLHDSLTGLYTKTFIEAEFKKIDCEENLPLGIVLCAVKNLKEINKSRGKETGDELLVKTADLIKNLFRDEDFFARWSGSKFLIIMPYAPNRRVQSLVQRIMKISEKIRAGGEPLLLSAGFAVKSSTEENMADVIQKAGEALSDNQQSER